jgi:hypothetical protein
MFALEREEKSWLWVAAHCLAVSPSLSLCTAQRAASASFCMKLFKEFVDFS